MTFLTIKSSNEGTVELEDSVFHDPQELHDPHRISDEPLPVDFSVTLLDDIDKELKEQRRQAHRDDLLRQITEFNSDAQYSKSPLETYCQRVCNIVGVVVLYPWFMVAAFWQGVYEGRAR